MATVPDPTEEKNQEVIPPQPMSQDVINAISSLCMNGYITAMQSIKGDVHIMDIANPRTVIQYHAGQQDWTGDCPSQ